MHFALVMVGAHNGQVYRDEVLEGARLGKVLLIEPVPYLFQQLQRTYESVANVICWQRCVSDKTGPVRFFAPLPDATRAFSLADHLGSMSSEHAVKHEPHLAGHIQEIEAEGITLRDIVRQLGMTSLDVLYTDTEGYDTTILPLFPFDVLRPNKILFEVKHGDGTFNIGRKVGTLLIMLDVLGYDIRVVDHENCMATRRQPPQ